jgi:hypothetical protein
MTKAKSRLHKKTFNEKLKPIVLFATTLTLISFAKLTGAILDTKKVQVEAAEYQKPVVVVTGQENYTEKQKIYAYIVEVFGDQAANAITIINTCENKDFNPKATNWNSNGTEDVGIFMINSVHGYSEEQLQDWKFNIDAAKKIYDNNGWSAWACSYKINVKSFWQN